MRNQFKKNSTYIKKIGGCNIITLYSACLRPCYRIVIINNNRNKLM